MIMLNKKSCINCDERDLVKHNEEINKILGELRKLDNYDCVVLHKYQDIGHRNKDLQVININLWDIYELAELADFKNGVDFLIDDEGFLNLSVYGQTYKLGGESHFIHAVFKIIPHDEDLNFLNISEFSEQWPKEDLFLYNFSEDFIEDAYQYYLKKKEGKQDD